jgi:hypothetical protein
MKVWPSFAVALALLFGTAAGAGERGYKVIEKNGEKLYCSKRLATGSHLKQQQTCLTQKELDELKDATRRGLQNISRQAPPPQGT